MAHALASPWCIQPHKPPGCRSAPAPPTTPSHLIVPGEAADLLVEDPIPPAPPQRLLANQWVCHLAWPSWRPALSAKQPHRALQQA
eukprot:1352846-Lingulodinium_polyedra.AAC.1